MTIRLRVNGVEFDNFEAVSATISLDNLCNVFSFTCAATGADPFPIKWFDKIEILVNDEIKITGFVEIIDIKYGEDGHSLSISGRDRASDLLDSDIDAFDSIKPPITLKAFIEAFIANIGSDLKVSVADGLVLEEFNPAEERFIFSSGDSAWEHIQNAARKRQVLLTTDAKGDIVITRSSQEILKGALIQNLVDDTDGTNNIKSGSASYDSTELYNKYVIVSQRNPTSEESAGTTGLKTVVDQRGGAISAGVRVGRQLVVDAELASSDGQDINRAIWEANIRITRSRTYSVLLAGHDFNGVVWPINRLVQVLDDFAGIGSQMLINSTTFNYDQRGGSTTEMTLVNRNAYTLDLLDDQFNVTARNVS